MKTKTITHNRCRTAIIVLTIALSMGVASQAGAWMGNQGNHDCDRTMSGKMMMHNGWMGNMMGQQTNPTLTTEQQQQVKDIEADYQADLQAKEAAIQSKIAEIKTAYADNSTTVGQLNTLRSDLHNLKRDYRQTRMTINTKISAALGTDYYGTGAWGPQYCLMDNMDTNDMMGDQGQMMGNNHGRHCRW